jgi:hypothetical protein
MQPLCATAYGNGRQPLYATLVSYIKHYATAYGNGRQPLYATLVSYIKHYATALDNRLWKRYVTALGNRLWKWYVTACLVTYPVRQPLMETVLVLSKSLEPLHLFSRKARTATASLLIPVSINGCHL